MLCIVGLLCVQLSGLHHHRHVDLHEAGTPHAVQLHFEDAGWHSRAESAEHRHALTASATHPHLDIETKALGDGLTKVLSILLLGLLGISWLVLPRPAPLRLDRPATIPLARKRSCYDGPPPSQAPPPFLSRTHRA